ncbi:hypothetical protein C922_00255 [Plasmodium inui San Antonio 1]|uniref:Uncharacterized protein n=1 Tax=Plasmodium inui San Antonio 1 TaxID=1237626 RepID=W7A855_9APIC|nr:hypothetical protein C922_00255 [Plasmodium inui San Antonio 1]EUD69392.1 hypothetical protein C922_00255 [Plasmodium inui San Antonio 1]
MKGAKKAGRKASPNQEKPYGDQSFMKLYDSGSEYTMDNNDGGPTFAHLKNIKICNEDKKKTLSKICCTKNYLFVGSSSLFSQVRVFNYTNLINSKKESEDLGSIPIKGDNTQTSEGQSKKNKKEEPCGQNTHGEAFISLCDIYRKSKFYTAKRDYSKDNMLSIDLFQNKINRKNVKRSDSVHKKVHQGHSTNEANSKEIAPKGERDISDNIVKEEKEKKKEKKPTQIDLKDKLMNFNQKGYLELSDNETTFREEYLYYDNFAGITPPKKDIHPIRITNEMRENERIKREKEEEMEKKKKIDEENWRNEQLAKNGFYLNKDMLEINVDVIKRKTTQVNNLLEYIGAFVNVSSPIILMKTNGEENILSVLTFGGDVYSYDISEHSLKQLREKRIKKIEFFSNIENYFIQQEKNNTSNEFLEEDFSEEVTASPLSLSKSHFTNSVKYFDFLPDDKTLICVGQNKDYFLSFINCHNGKKIIYHKKIKVKKPNHNIALNSNKMSKDKMLPTLMHDFSYLYVEREKKNFNGEIGNYVYIGSSCGYLVFIFLGDKFLRFVNNLLIDDHVRSGSLFTYDEGSDEKEWAKIVTQSVLGNVDDVYTVRKDQLCALFGDEHNLGSGTKMNMNGSRSGNLDDNLHGNVGGNLSSTAHRPSDQGTPADNPKENIFKEADHNSFSYAFCIAKNVKINSIISLNTHKNEHIHLIVGLNDGRLLDFLFRISPHFTPTSSSITSCGYYPTLSQNCSENKSSYNKSQRNGNTECAADNPSSRIDNINFIQENEKELYDFTGLHKSSKISKINLYQSDSQHVLLFINSNMKRIREVSDKKFYTTYVLNMYSKQISILHEHLAYIIDSCASSHFYFCLDDNNTIAVFDSTRER